MVCEWLVFGVTWWAKIVLLEVNDFVVGGFEVECLAVCGGIGVFC